MGRYALLTFNPIVAVDDLPIPIAGMTEMAELALLRLQTRRLPRGLMHRVRQRS